MLPSANSCLRTNFCASEFFSPGGTESRSNRWSPNTDQGSYERVTIPLGSGQRTVEIWISSTDLTDLDNLGTNEIYEKLTADLGDWFQEKEPSGAVLERDDASDQGLVTRKRGMPEGAVLPEHIDYSKPPASLPWPERHRQSLPILSDPYLRAIAVSKLVTNWDFLNKGHMDEVLMFGMNQFPISRPPEEVTEALKNGYCQSSKQLSLLVVNMGNLCRPMQFADKRCMSPTQNARTKRQNFILAQACCANSSSIIGLTFG